MCLWCRLVYEWLLREIFQPMLDWVTETWRQCTQQPCNWWCLCCNKWFCWLLLIILAILIIILIIIVYAVVTVVCGVCFVVCFLLCIFFWISQQTPIENCLNWCNTGRLAPWDRDRPVDPQEPPSEIQPPVGPGGGVSGGGSVSRYSPRSMLTAGVMISPGALRVGSAAQLQELARWKTMLLRPRRVCLELPGLSSEERSWWQSRLNHHLAACGCKEGAAMLAITIVAFVSYCLVFQSLNLVLGAALILGGALLGKLAGMLNAQVRLSILSRQLWVKCDGNGH